MIKRSEPITPDKLKNIKRMSIKTVCDLMGRVNDEIAAAWPRYDDQLETCYSLLFDELYRRDAKAIDRWCEEEEPNNNPYKHFVPEVGAGEGAE